MKLYLDDCRETPPGWRRANTAWEAIGLLILAGMRGEEVEAISLDHDLGDESTAGTGMDVLDWMLKVDIVPDDLYFHTANEPARRIMISKLRSWKKAKELPSDTTK